MKLNDVLTKVMDYWLVAGNVCVSRCPSTGISLRVCWVGGQCVMYYWKYGQRSMITVPMVISSNTDDLNCQISW